MAKVPNGGVHHRRRPCPRAFELVTRTGQMLRATVKPAPEQVERSLESDAHACGASTS